MGHEKEKKKCADLTDKDGERKGKIERHKEKDLHRR